MWACEIPTGLCACHAFKSLLVKLFVGQATDRFSSGINPWSHFPKCQTIPLNAIWDEAVGVTSTNSKSQKIILAAWGSLDNTWETNNCLPKPKKMWMLWSHRAMQPEALLRMFGKRWTNQENIPLQFRRHHTLSLAAWNNNEYSQYNCTSVQCSYSLTSDKLYNFQYKYLKLS